MRHTRPKSRREVSKSRRDVSIDATYSAISTHRRGKLSEVGGGGASPLLRDCKTKHSHYCSRLPAGSREDKGRKTTTGYCCRWSRRKECKKNESGGRYYSSCGRHDRRKQTLLSSRERPEKTTTRLRGLTQERQTKKLSNFLPYDGRNPHAFFGILALDVNTSWLISAHFTSTSTHRKKRIEKKKQARRGASKNKTKIGQCDDKKMFLYQ